VCGSAQRSCAVTGYLLHLIAGALDCYRNRELKTIGNSAQRSCAVLAQSRIISAHGVCGSVQRSCAVLAQSRIKNYFRTQSVWFCTTKLCSYWLFAALDCWRTRLLCNRELTVHCNSVQRSCAVLAQSRIISAHGVCGSAQRSVWFCTTECVVLHNEVVQRSV